MFVNACTLQYQETEYHEKALLLRIAEGDTEAFAALYHQSLTTLHPFLLKMLKSEEAVKEVVQEAFVRVWLNRDKLPEINSANAWVSRIALNECYRFLKKQGLQQQLQQRQLAQQPLHAVNKGFDQLSLAETQRLVTTAIAQLPERRRLIYRMSREKGMKIPEIAAELNLSPGYVKKALVLSLHAIRQHLSAAGKLVSFWWVLKNF